MKFDQHPVQSVLDTIGAGATPPPDEFEKVAAEVTRPDLGESDLSTYAVRRALEAAHAEIKQLQQTGEFGQARQVARERGKELARKLPDYRAPADDRSIKEIVDSIPRSF